MRPKFTVWIALLIAILITVILRVVELGFDLTRIATAMWRAGGSFTGQAELGGWVLAVLFWWAVMYALGRFIRVH